jgi:hypothetical protein
MRRLENCVNYQFGRKPETVKEALSPLQNKINFRFTLRVVMETSYKLCDNEIEQGKVVLSEACR